jgi:3-hydroxyacyl-[acyl-carrier-protein] dehydratase
MRYVLLDRITRLEPPDHAEGVRCVSLSDDVFADHFPGYPILPGALILESMAQLGGVLIEASMRLRGRNDLHALLVTVDKAKLRQQVRPGDKMLLSCKGVLVHEDGGLVRCEARVDGRLVAEAEQGFAFAEVKHPQLIARRREVLNTWLSHEPAGPPRGR